MKRDIAGQSFSLEKVPPKVSFKGAHPPVHGSICLQTINSSMGKLGDLKEKLAKCL